MTGDAVSGAVKANVWYAVNQLLMRSDLIKRKVRNNDLLLSGTVYSLGTCVDQTLSEEGWSRELSF